MFNDNENYLLLQNDIHRERLKQLDNKKRWNSGMNPEYNNSHPVNCRPVNMRHDVIIAFLCIFYFCYIFNSALVTIELIFHDKKKH